jgi:uncharacterized protein YndB with AHSA1/START domain
MKLETTLIINKPVVMVWNFFDNPNNMGKWLTGFKSFELVSGSQGQVGSKARHVYEEGSRKIVLDEEITARQKYHHFAGKLTHPTMTSLVDITFTDLHDGRTQVVAINDFAFQTFLYKLMSPFISGSIRKRQDGDYQRLKEAIEAESD